MKKLLLLLITLLLLTNVSYASFPIPETEQIEFLEESNELFESPKKDISWIYSISSFLLGILVCFFALLSFGSAMGGGHPDTFLMNNITILLLISKW